MQRWLWKNGRRGSLMGFGVVGTSKRAKTSGVRISALAKAWMSCFCHETAITKICGESGTVSLTGSGRAWLMLTAPTPELLGFDVTWRAGFAHTHFVSTRLEAQHMACAERVYACLESKKRCSCQEEGRLQQPSGGPKQSGMHDSTCRSCSSGHHRSGNRQGGLEAPR
jgi:hypothetical protein